MKYSLALAISGLALFAALEMTVFTEETTNRVIVSYERPENPDYLRIYTLLYEKNHSLEKLQKLLSPFRLPWALEITLKECNGEADAMYFDGIITICYEYVHELWNAMPSETTKAGIEPIDTVVGPFLDTVLHEFAHALFDYLDIPVLGREEDAADQVSAYMYLQLDPAEARRLIMGTVYTYKAEVDDTDPPTLAEFAYEHSTSEQRRFNLLCQAYGSDPEYFKDVAIWGELPQSRMDVCVEEYELIELAIQTLMTPYVDQDLVKQVLNKTWLPEKTSRMLIKEKRHHF